MSKEHGRDKFRYLFSVSAALVVGIATACGRPVPENSNSIKVDEKTNGSYAYRISKPSRGILKITTAYNPHVIDRALHDIRDIQRCDVELVAYGRDSHSFDGEIMYLKEPEGHNCYPDLPIDPSA